METYDVLKDGTKVSHRYATVVEVTFKNVIMEKAQTDVAAATLTMHLADYKGGEFPVHQLNEQQIAILTGVAWWPMHRTLLAVLALAVEVDETTYEAYWVDPVAERGLKFDAAS